MIAATTYQKKKERVDYSSLIVMSKEVKNLDPTRTTGLRASFSSAMDKRFNQLKSLINQAIIERDCFGLKETTHLLSINQISGANLNDSLPSHQAFKFTTSSGKVDEFMSWLKEQEKKGILETKKISQLGSAAEEAWTNMYISDSYKRGVQRAAYELEKGGMEFPANSSTGVVASINTPFHMDRVGLLFTRTFSDLKGITQAMDTQISRILAQGLVDGDNPRTLAKKINDQVEGIGKARARTLARTEIIRAHHAGMIGEYRNWGLAGVRVQAEWVTAGFKVCPKCQENEGKIYTLDEIEGMIPFHPNCRCMALPYLGKEEKEKPVVEKISMWNSSQPFKSIRKMGIQSFEVDSGPEVTYKKGTELIGKTISGVLDNCPTLRKRIKELEIQGLGLDNIRIRGDVEFFSNGSTNGVYIHGIKKIIITKYGNLKEKNIIVGKFNTCNSMPQILRHEYAHYLQDSVLSSELNSEWNVLYHSQYLGIKKVSTYATTNDLEAFAECFATFTHPKYSRGILEKPIEDFMIKITGKKL